MKKREIYNYEQATSNKQQATSNKQQAARLLITSKRALFTSMVAVSLLGSVTSIVSANTTDNATATSISTQSKTVTMDINYPVTKDGKKTTVLLKNVTMTPGGFQTDVSLPYFAGYTAKYNVDGALVDGDDNTVGVAIDKDGKTLHYIGEVVYVKNGAGSGSSSESNNGSSSSSSNTNSGSSSNTNSGSSSHTTGNTGSNGGSNSNSNSTSSANKTTTGSADAVAKAKTQATNTINNAKGVTPTMKAQANSQVNKATTAAGTKAVTDAMTKPADTKTGDVQTGETHVIRNLVIAMTAAISATALGAFIIKKVSKQK